MSAQPSPNKISPNSAGGFFSSPWVVYLLPFAIYLVVGTFEPPPPPEQGEEVAAPWLDLGLRYEHYPWIYGTKILLTIIAILTVARWYPRRQTVHPFAFVVGVVGVVAWVALAHFQKWLVATLDIEQLTNWLGGHRPAYNPLEQLGHTPAGYLFLVVRFAGLAAIVPLIEEMFLRGFLMRFFVRPDWWNVPIGTPDLWGIAAAIALPILMHPQEALAAAAWFAAVAWLVLRTKNVWDCVAAHAITNLLLGVYVVASGQWWLM